MIRHIFIAILLFAAANAVRGANYPAPSENDYAIHNFKFASGETLRNCAFTTAPWGVLRGMHREKQRTQC